MRAQTPSYVVSVKLQLPITVENYLEKSFHIVNSAYNEALNFGLRHFEYMKQNSTYQELLETRRDLFQKAEKEKKTKTFKIQKKEIDKALTEIRKDYSLTEYGLSVHLSKQRRKSCSSYKHLNSGELQVVASQAYKTLEKVLFYQIKPDKVRFRSKFDLDVSYRNRVNNTGTRLEESNKKGIAYRLYLHKASTFVDIPVKAFNHYQQMSILRSERIKYVQIVRKTIRGKKMYYLQIVCEGYPPAKVSKGEGVVGIDPGISTVSYVTSTEVAIVDLVPSNINQKEKNIKYLSRRIERSRRVNNPDCYHDNGTIKKRSNFNPLSKRAQRLLNRSQKTYRSLSEERKKLQGKLITHLVSQASVIKIEELNVKGLQKRAKDIRINPKTNRPFRNKRFGKSIFRAAPSTFREALRKRADQLGIELVMISPKDVKPSQYNHISKTFEKKSLSTRIFDLSPEWTGIQRDLYSAFLIRNIENNHYKQKNLEEDFPNFYTQMKDFLQQPRQTKRLSWYLS